MIQYDFMLAFLSFFAKEHPYSICKFPKIPEGNIMICGRGSSAWRSDHYYTQFDNCKLTDISLFRAVAENYLCTNSLQALDPKDEVIFVQEQLQNNIDTMPHKLRWQKKMVRPQRKN